jgi:hypothetical protein
VTTGSFVAATFFILIFGGGFCFVAVGAGYVLHDLFFSGWQRGAYCPKCVKPVDCAYNLVRNGSQVSVCPRCARGVNGGAWPTGVFRRRWGRWTMKGGAK